ncbi:MAG TPA: hypothetical protein PKW95_17085 [bacterium]|nr:hypothetical protein [bacterium]
MKRENGTLGNATLATTILFFFLFAAAHPAAGNDSWDDDEDPVHYIGLHDFAVAFNPEGGYQYTTVLDIIEFDETDFNSPDLTSVTNAIAVDVNGQSYYAGYNINNGFNASRYSRIRSFDATGQLIWTYKLAGINSDANDLKIAPAGGVYYAGGQGEEYYTAYLDADGNVVWENVVSAEPEYTYGRANALVVDDAGLLYTTGFQKQSDQVDVVTLKYDAQGNRIWTATYFSPGADSQGFSLAVNQDGEVFVGGFTAEGEDQDGLLIKYSAEGDELWVRTINETNRAITVHAVAADSDGGIIVAGEGVTYVTPHPFIRKYDNNGTELWALTDDWGYSSVGHLNSTRAIAIDDQNTIYATVSPDEPTYITYKISPEGELLWGLLDENETESDIDIALDDELNLIVKIGNPCGYSQYDSDGNLLKQQIYSIENEYYYYDVSCDAMAVDAAGLVYVAGSYWTERTQYYDDDNGDDDDDDNDDNDDHGGGDYYNDDDDNDDDDDDNGCGR